MTTALALRPVQTSTPTRPRLVVQIMVGAPKDGLGGKYDRFEVTGDQEMVDRFYVWWAEVGLQNMASALANGCCFILCDDGDGFGGGGNGPAPSKYFARREETHAELGYEPALAVAA